MMTFEYRGYEAQGRKVRGLVEALDLKEAREKLTAQGILPERVVPTSSLRRRAWRRRQIAETRALAFRELAALLRAGLPLSGAMELLIASPEYGAYRAEMAAARDRVREGASLAAGWSQADATLSPFERSVIEAGERSGHLDVALERLASFLDEQLHLHDRIVTMLIYPAFVVIMALVIGTVMLGVMLPAIGRLLVESRVPLPLITRAMMMAGRWAMPVLGLVALAAVGIGVRERSRAAARPEVAQAWDRRLLRLPVAGRARRLLINLRFTRLLALLLRGGVPAVEAVALAGRATGSAWTGTLTERQAEQIRHGASLADALREVEPFSRSLIASIRAGEAGGNLVDLLDAAAERAQQQWERLVARAVTLIEPVLILLIGIFVLLIAVSILLPILSINQAMQ